MHMKFENDLSDYWPTFLLLYEQSFLWATEVCKHVLDLGPMAQSGAHPAVLRSRKTVQYS